MRRLPGASRTVGKATIGLLYGCGVVQGLALVSFPAASAIFVDPAGFALSGTQYGGMFIPQVMLAIGTAALGPLLTPRLGLRGVLMLGLGGDLVSMALLAASPLLIGSTAAFVVLCAATGALGLGFGATVMTLNTVVEGLFPARADGAVLALNALLGLGTALAPLLVVLFTAVGAWWLLPLLMTGLATFFLSWLAALQAPLGRGQGVAEVGRLPARFWLYAAVALLYGVVETLNGNWATIYLSAERHVSAQSASFALTGFWLMVTLGRVIFALLGRVLAMARVYVVLPLALAVVFQIAARVDGAAAGIAVFAVAGLACSAFLPLSISLGGGEFPRRAATMSGELIAFYQVGYGLAAFGVGPLRALGGVDYATAFSIGSGVAAALGFVAWLVVRRGTKPG